MSISKATSFLFLLITVFFLLSQTLPHVAALAPPEIVEICAKSIEKTLCNDFLKNMPGMKTANFKTAGLITLDSVRDHVIETAVNIADLLGGFFVDPKTNGTYKSCLISYYDAAKDIATTTISLNIDDYNGANIQASAAQDKVKHCYDGVKQGSTQPGIELKRAVTFDISLIDLVLIITNKLLGK